MSFYTLEKIGNQLREVREAIRRETLPIRHFKHCNADCPSAAAPSFDDSGWADFSIGEHWGGYDEVSWFRTRVRIPDAWRDHKLALRFLVGPRDGGQSTAEARLFVNGQALQAIDAWHEQAWLPPETYAQEGEIAVALRAWSGVYGPPPRRQFKLAELVWIDVATESFFFLADTLHKTVQVLDANDLRRERMLAALNDAFHCLDFTVPKSDAFYASAAEAERRLSTAVREWACVDEIKPAVVAIGHAHIDLAWLWRRRHSREKAVRSFTTVLHLMRQYPEYCFVHSAPQAYKFLQQDDSELYARVKEHIAAGRWEITGGMWVEADTNLPSGESLVRQFLLGQQFIRDEFGRESTVLWLPDVFGYSWALPQIALKSGIRAFMTTKISWSQVNRFPYDTFRWRGADGAELLTHFVTTPDPGAPFYTYNGRLEPRDVKGLWEQYRQKDVNDELLHLFGWGDGGGGPTQEMLEAARAMRNLPGLPRVTPGTAEPYFARLAQRLEGQPLPTWDGELYLEYHRGTYTSQAANKRANRLAEVLYHDAEWLSALAEVVTGKPAYPRADLRQGWELILFNQFHDILPGSSICEVYADSREDYAAIQGIGRLAIERAELAIVRLIAAAEPGVVAFNPLSWPRAGVVALPWSDALAGQGLRGPEGETLPAQVIDNRGQKEILFAVPPTPSLGYKTFKLGPLPPDPAQPGLAVSPGALENRFYRLSLDEHGHIDSLYDKLRGREVLAPGARANVLQAFEDKPMNFDAWDIDLYYQEKMRVADDLIEAVVEESGPVRGVLRLQWRFHDSVITQRLTIYRDSPRIDFYTEVDWHQHQVLLKVAFPVAIRSTRATYDIQFGQIERPTHWNTSWDYARFEAVAHKWVDLSEGDYGVALLNDCKYGHDVKDNVLRLTLIKSAIDPDPQADQGQHVFTYSLLPHAGDWRAGGVIEEGYDLNDPLRAVPIAAQPAGRLPDEFQFVACDRAHVIVETIKKAERDDAWVVRVYESQQCRAAAVHLDFGRPVARAVECNLIEADELPVEHDGHRLTFAVQPCEIKTFKVWLEG